MIYPQNVEEVLPFVVVVVRPSVVAEHLHRRWNEEVRHPVLQTLVDFGQEVRP
jgi:hypothetical protein